MKELDFEIWKIKRGQKDHSNLTWSYLKIRFVCLKLKFWNWQTRKTVETKMAGRREEVQSVTCAACKSRGPPHCLFIRKLSYVHGIWLKLPHQGYCAIVHPHYSWTFRSRNLRKRQKKLEIMVTWKTLHTFWKKYENLVERLRGFSKSRFFSRGSWKQCDPT